MPNLLEEDRISLTELARREGVNICTVWRWAQRGVKGIKLETFCVGGRRYTTQEAFARFVERSTAAANETSASSTSNHDTDRHERLVEKQLEEAGL